MIKILLDNLPQNSIIKIKPNSVFSVLESSEDEADVGFIANKIAGMLNNELSYIKNQCVPVMVEIAGLLEKEIGGVVGDNSINNYVINEVTMPSIITELSDRNILTNSEELPIMINSALSIPVPAEDIRSYTKHSNDIINEYLMMVVGKYNDEQIKTIWEKYLTNISASNDNYGSLGFNGVRLIEEAIVLFALMSNIKETKPLGVSTSITNYDSIINVAYNFVTACLSKAVITFNRQVNVGRLVLARTESEIFVNSVVYDGFLEAGSPEMLLGIIIGGANTDNLVFKDDILAVGSELVNQWEEKSRYVRALNASEYAKNQRYAYGIVGRKIMSELLPKYILEKSAVTEDTINNKISELAASLPNSVLLDTKFMAREIMGKIILPNTNFHKFTGYMLEYIRQDSKLLPSDAASLAIIDILLDYLLEQVDLVNNG